MKEHKTNKEILQEGFFSKKPTSSQRMSSKLDRQAGYNAKDKFDKASGKGGYASLFDKFGNGFLPIADMDEASRRLLKTFGAVVGNNSIKSKSSKSVKTFPIMISDNVDTDTAMSLKKVLEEQYSEYLAMLISNQVIDVGEFKTSDPGGDTVAVQAIGAYHKDSDISTSSQRRNIGDIARNKGELTTDDYAKYFSGYNLFRESEEYSNILENNESSLKYILEDAIIVPSDKADALIEKLLESTDFWSKRYVQDRKGQKFNPNAYEDLIKKYEGKGNTFKYTEFDDFDESQIDKDSKYWDYKKYAMDTKHEIERLGDRISEIVQVLDTIKGSLVSPNYDSLSENSYYNEIKSLGGRHKKIKQALADKRKAEVELSKLETKFNKFEDDKNIAFEAAKRKTFKILKAKLESDEITTSPELEKATALLVSRRLSGEDYINYLVDVLTIPIPPAKQKKIIRDYPSLNIKTGDDLDIGKNEKMAAHVYAMRKFNNKYMINKDAKEIEKDFDSPGLLNKFRRRSKKYLRSYNSFLKNKRVSKNAKALAIEIDRYGKSDVKDINREVKDRDKEDHISKTINSFASTLMSMTAASEGKMFVKGFNEHVEYDIVREEIERTDKELEYALDDLSEASFKTKGVSKKPRKGMLDVPRHSTRSQMAYGSAEINRRDEKDRRFHQPLMIKVQFKERLSDGTFSDNELTAVIGVLGRIIRVPSEEMKYILQANYEKDTVRQLTTSLASGKLVLNSLANIFGNKQIKKDIKNLPKSHELWANLNKLSKIASSSRMAGKDNDVMANAHLVFSMKEVDDVRSELGVDYIRDRKSSADLMNRYSAFSLMVVNDIQEKLYIFDDAEGSGWNTVSYSMLKNNKSDEVGALGELLRSMKK
jgi:hypothetical protein